MRVRISIRNVTVALSAVAAFFVGASVVGQVGRFVLGWGDPWGLARMTDVGIEQNLPTYFSVLLILLNASLLTLVALSLRDSRDGWCWKVLAAGFFYLAFDEGFHVHESWVDPMRQLLGMEHLGLFYFAWVVPGLLIVLVLGLLLAGFLRRLPRKYRTRFLASAFMFLGGCLGLEMLNGWWQELHGSERLAAHLMSDLEEALEMAGMIFFLDSLGRYMSDSVQEVQLTWQYGA